MKLSASIRTASATVLLALIVTGWCTAAAVPVADARRRRMQDIPAVTSGEGGDRRLQSQLSNLVAIVEPVLRKFGVTKTVADLLDLDIIQRPRAAPGDLQIPGQSQPRTRRDLQSPLDQVVSDLERIAKSIAGGHLEELPINVVCRIIGLTSQLQTVVQGLQDLPIVDGQEQLRSLRSLLNDVQGQLLQARDAACAEQKP
jgi:hypothetical protein